MTPYLHNSQWQSEDSDSGIGLAEAPAKPQLKEPPMYQVVLLNDDYTPMDFVDRKSVV